MVTELKESMTLPEIVRDSRRKDEEAKRKREGEE